MMKSHRFIVKGIVQGVYYRKNIAENALKASFDGYVKNLSDGSVEACVSCTEERLEEFISILKKGSPNSRVDSIDHTICDEVFQNGFNIRY